MSRTQTIRVMTVDDHEILRSGIRYSLQAHKDLELVAEARSGEEALQLCAEAQPDVVLMDMSMPGMDGVQATQAIRAASPQVQVLVLTSFYDKELVQRAMQAGATGYLIKGTSAKELAEAIRVANSGQTILSQEATQALIQSDAATSDLGNDLTKREVEVLALLAKGMSNAQIAQQLTYQRLHGQASRALHPLQAGRRESRRGHSPGPTAQSHPNQDLDNYHFGLDRNSRRRLSFARCARGGFLCILVLRCMVIGRTLGLRTTGPLLAGSLKDHPCAQSWAALMILPFLNSGVAGANLDFRASGKYACSP